MRPSALWSGPVMRWGLVAFGVSCRMHRLGWSTLLLMVLGAAGCAEPDSVELGAACKQQVECKDPADTCMTLGTESLCSMACSATTTCPEGYACARMDVRVEGADGAGKADAQGYCLAESRLGSHIATIAPKDRGKSKRKRRGKRKGKRNTKARD